MKQNDTKTDGLDIDHSTCSLDEWLNDLGHFLAKHGADEIEWDAIDKIRKLFKENVEATRR